MGFLEEFLKVNEREHVRRETQPMAARSWNPPEVGRWRLNTNVAFSKDRTKMGLGMIVRDSVGEVMMCATSPHTPVSNVVQAEGEAMKFGMQYAYEAGLSNLISLVKGSSSVRGHTQIIVDEIINKAGLMNYVSFKFAYRSCNKCAHSLTKLALDYDEVLVWMEESPEAVTPLVLADSLI
ncbi:Biotinidase [Bienertia sinuspersici]